MVDKPYRPSTSQLLRTSFALDRGYADKVNRLRHEHGAGSITDYLKGLIALDWLRTKGPLDLSDAPAWIVTAFRLDVTEGKIQPPPK